MSNKPSNYAELVPLVAALADQTIDDTALARLNELLRDDAGARKYYVDFMGVHCGLQQQITPAVDLTAFGVTVAEEVSEPEDDRSILWEALELERKARIEREAAAALEKQQSEIKEAERRESMRLLSGLHKQDTGSQTKHYVIPKPLFYGSIAALIAIAVAIIWPMMQREQTTRPTIDEGPQFVQVATIIERLGDQWQGGDHDMASSDAVFDEELNLTDGIVKIEFKSGAEVIVEGPCRFKPVSDKELELIDGRIVGICDTPDSKLFVVRTNNSKITDLGTEFGVSTNGSLTEAHVFRGEVMVDRLSKDGKNAEKVNLQAGRAARVGQRIDLIENTRTVADQFKRRVIKEIDLVDIVAGGDGTQGKRGAGIDPASADRYTTAPRDFNMKPRGGFRIVRESNFIDGVFVANGPMKVTSDGDRWEDCPPTANEYWGYIWAGGKLPHEFIGGIDRLPTVIDGIDYASEGRGCLDMVSNKGITFDLKEIAKAHGGLLPKRFTATVANTWTKDIGHGADFPQEAMIDKSASFHVLIDGAIRGENAFAKNLRTLADGSVMIDVPLLPGDRFITLVTTDDGDGIGKDWIVVGDPTIELAP